MRRFAFRLAKELGMTVQELLSRISSDELTEWIAYFQLEPFGEERGDLRAGIISATIANAMGGGKGAKAKPADFMPDFERKASDDKTIAMKLQIWVNSVRAARGAS